MFDFEKWEIWATAVVGVRMVISESQVMKIIEEVVSVFEDELDKVLNLGQRSKWNTCQGCELLGGRKLVSCCCGEEASDSADWPQSVSPSQGRKLFTASCARRVLQGGPLRWGGRRSCAGRQESLRRAAAGAAPPDGRRRQEVATAGALRQLTLRWV